MNIIKILILNNLSRYRLILLAVVITAVILTACNNKIIDPPQDEEPLPKLTIINEDVSCTEVWLKIKVDSLNSPAEIKLYRDTSLILNLSASGGLNLDTLYYEENLLPNRSYVYKLILTYNNKEYTESINVTTLNITSSNFTWETFEFGQHSSSVLYDVAIVGEQIWAVGEIYMNDAQGNPDPKLYNAVHWDGEKWEVKRILYNGNTWVIRTLFAFNANDIWFSAFVRYDGERFIQLPIPDILMGWSVNKLWGTSSSNLYAVGNNGNIAHYNGSSWRKIESGTELSLTDVYGNGKGKVYAAGVNSQQVRGVILEGNENGEFKTMIKGELISESELFKPNLYGSVGAVWIDENKTVYAGGNLLYQYKNNRWNYVESLPENTISGNPGSFYRGVITSIRGNKVNDIIIAGGRNTLIHFNGVGWQKLGMPYDPSSNIVWRGIDIKENTAISVGNRGSKAFIILLNR